MGEVYGADNKRRNKWPTLAQRSTMRYPSFWQLRCEKEGERMNRFGDNNVARARSLGQVPDTRRYKVGRGT